MTTFKQNSAAPTRKVTAAGIGGVAGTVIAAAFAASGVPFLEQFVAYPGLEAAIATATAFIAAYWIEEAA